MADGAQTEQMALQEMAQHLDEMRTQQAELKGEIGDMFSEMKADLLGILKQALKLPEQTTVTNPNPSVETVTNLEPFVEPMKSSGPFIESLKHASVLQVPGSVSDVFLVHRVDSHVKEVEELPQESTNGNEKNVARQVFDEMPLALSSKEKQRKSLKAWKFKFKISFKRSKLMDNMLSVGEETVLLDKVHKETIWGCVKKEFKEIMAACGKKRIDQFKIGEETLKPAVYDGTVQFRVWDCGGSPLECADESYCDGKSSEEAVTVLEACPQLLNTFFRICDNNKLDNSWVCNDRQTMAVYDAENKKLLNIEVGAKKGKNSFMNPQPLHDKRITRALLVGLVGTEEKLSERLSLANYVWKPGELLGVQDHWDWISEVHNMGSVLKIMQRFHGLHLQGIINMDMRFREVIVHDVLSVKVCLSVCNRKFEAELEVYFLAHHNSKNQKIAGGLIYGYVKFHLKHKWRSRLELVISENEQPPECVDDESSVDEKLIEVIAEETALEPMDESGCNFYKERNLNSLLCQSLRLLHFEESSDTTVPCLNLETKALSSLLSVGGIMLLSDSKQQSLLDPYADLPCSRHISSDMVCGFLQPLLIVAINSRMILVSSGIIFVDDIVVTLRNTLGDESVLRMEEVCIEGIKHNLEFVIDRRWVEYWINTHVFTLTNSGLRLSSSEYTKNTLILVYLLCTLSSSRLFVKTYAGCIVALLMVSDAERLIQSVSPLIFSDLLCVKNLILVRIKMVLLLEFLWLILFTSKMFESSNVPQNKNQTDQKLSSYWKLLLRLLPLHINRWRSFYLLVIKSLFKGKVESVSFNVAVTSCSKYEGLVCVLERKKLRNIEDDINHLKRLLATMEGLAQKISCGLLCGDGKFHLKHKWKSRLTQVLYGLQFGVDNIVLFTSPDMMLFSNNHKLLHPETEFCTQYNDLELLNTEHHTFSGLDYFTYLNFRWNKALHCGCEAGHISSGFFSIGDVYGFFTCSKLQTGDETQEKRLLFLNNNNKVDHTIKENWFHSEPMIREVYHLQRPPELIELQGNPNFITKVLVQWKEHPPDQCFSGSQWQEFNLSSLRTRMFRRGKYCDRIISNPGSHKPDFSQSLLFMVQL